MSELSKSVLKEKSDAAFPPLKLEHVYSPQIDNEIISSPYFILGRCVGMGMQPKFLGKDIVFIVISFPDLGRRGQQDKVFLLQHGMLLIRNLVYYF